MKPKKIDGWLVCMSCSPYRKFRGPDAAKLLAAHYLDAKHDEKVKK